MTDNTWGGQRADRCLTSSEALDELSTGRRRRWSAGRLAAIAFRADDVAGRDRGSRSVLASAGLLTAILGFLVTAATTCAGLGFGLPPVAAAALGCGWAGVAILLERRVLHRTVPADGEREAPHRLGASAVFVGLLGALPAWVGGLLARGTQASRVFGAVVAPLFGVLIVMVALAPLPALLNRVREVGRRERTDEMPFLIASGRSAVGPPPRRRAQLRLAMSWAGGMRRDLGLLWPSLGLVFRPVAGALMAPAALGGLAAWSVAASIPDTGLGGILIGPAWAFCCVGLLRHHAGELRFATPSVLLGARLVAAGTATLLATITAALLVLGVIMPAEGLGSEFGRATAVPGGIGTLCCSSPAAAWVVAGLGGVCLLAFVLPLIPLPATGGLREAYELRMRLVDRPAGGENRG